MRRGQAVGFPGQKQPVAAIAPAAPGYCTARRRAPDLLWLQAFAGADGAKLTALRTLVGRPGRSHAGDLCHWLPHVGERIDLDLQRQVDAGVAAGGLVGGEDDLGCLQRFAGAEDG